MAMKSWVESANLPGCDFPLENLPYGVFRQSGSVRIGVAIGDRVLDLRSCVQEGLLGELSAEIVAACSGDTLNALMALGPDVWSSLRKQLAALLNVEAEALVQERVSRQLVPIRDVEMQLPAQVGDYTDFYASVHHATRVGTLFRPDNPLLPNYKYVPIGYHGRASSVRASGEPVIRPNGQRMAPDAAAPEYGPSRRLDYELELG